MATILDTMFLPHVTQLGMRQTDTFLHKDFGCTFLCNQQSADGFFWTYFAEDLFSVSAYDVAIMEDMSPCYDYPEYFTIGIFNEPASEFIVGKRRAAPGILSYTMPGGTFSDQIRKGTRVNSTGITFSSKYLKELAARFHMDYERLVSSCFRMKKAQIFPGMELVIKQVFAARPAPGCETMYYEGKIMELLSMALGWQSNHTIFLPDGVLCDNDLESLERVAFHLQQNYQQPIEIEALSRIAYMGKTKLSFLFKQRYGMSIMEYLRNQRIHHAKILLSDSSITIDEVASKVGYQNQGSFAERFKLETGLTPSEYRKLFLPSR